MKFYTPLLSLSLAALTTAQSLVSILQSQGDLSTLLDLVVLANLTDALSTADNITIVAPTNAAFSELLKFDTPEAVAIKERDAGTVASLLRNHVFQGYYPSSEIGEVPTFVQSLLMPNEQNVRQPFTANTGGQYNGLIRNAKQVAILSSEFTVSRVIQADIRVGGGIVVHKIDSVLSFGTPLTIFTARYGYTGFNAALVASGLKLFSEIEITSSSESPITDVTVFIPQDKALEAIGSVLAGADIATVQEVLKHHIIKNNILFSPQLSNTSVTSLQGGQLVISVEDDGSIFVNNAKVVVPNIILYEGVAHVIDSQLQPSAPAASRVQFQGATSTSKLPFTSVTFASETTFAFSLDPLFTTAPAVAVTNTIIIDFPRTQSPATPSKQLAATSTTSRSASASAATKTGVAQYTGVATSERASQLFMTATMLFTAVIIALAL